MAGSYWVVDQLAVSGSLPTGAVPSAQFVPHVVGPPVESPEPFGVPSLFQRTEPAVVVLVGKFAVASLVSWAGSPLACL